MSDSSKPNDDREVSDLIAALIDGSMSDDDFRRMDEILRDDPEARQLYLDALQIHEELPEVALPQPDAEPMVRPRRFSGPVEPRQGLSLWQAGLAIAILLPIAFLVGTQLPRGGQPVAFDGDAHDPSAGQGASVPADIDVRFANLAHARFFGEMPPPIASAPKRQRDYVLMEGMVELAFPKGASAIIEGPAVFRVESDERLALDIGRCSVHAPEGAEGFQVETPEINVVDRGTRFSVHVSEDNATDVQVVEGAADVYPKQAEGQDAKPMEAFELRLNPAEARRFSYANPTRPMPLPYRSDQYQRQLPDRIVSYQAAQAEEGGANDLRSVTIQRGGKTCQYSVDELIAAQAVHFRAQDSHGYLIGDAKLPEARQEYAADRSIRTGVINIGGSRTPLAVDPEISSREDAGKRGTPGLAVEFDRPVKNGPGADVVFFELQMFSNPLAGDAFHVSPLKFEPGLHSHTITSYDLTLDSPEAVPVQKLYLQKFDRVPQSLQQLQEFACTPVVQAVKFHAIAVGIDLSDLGYEEGATVSGLFFQDALDNDDVVDPTFIAGLPEVDS